MGHPDGAGTAARAREPRQLGSGDFRRLAGDSSLLPSPIATNLRLIGFQVRRYLENLFVLIPRKDIILSVLLREVSSALCKHTVSHKSVGGPLLNTHAALLNKSFHASEHANFWSLHFESPFWFSAQENPRPVTQESRLCGGGLSVSKSLWGGAWRPSRLISCSCLLSVVQAVARQHLPGDRGKALR